MEGRVDGYINRMVFNDGVTGFAFAWLLLLVSLLMRRIISVHHVWVKERGGEGVD